MKVCLAILNYNGVHHLSELLPSIEAACAASDVPTHAVVLDNRSSGRDVDWIQKNFSSVECIIAPKNDFLFSYNQLLSSLRDEVVILLNNDTVVDERFVAPLIAHFQSVDVFSVSASSLDWTAKRRTIGPASLTYNNGLYDWRFDLARQETCHTLFSSGGFMAVDRKKFLELEGFNRLYYPAYCEDLDLCFRAWRRGWRCIYEPRSLVRHKESGSWSLSDAGRPLPLNLRNSLLFQWSTLPKREDSWKGTLQMLRHSLHSLRLGSAMWLKVWLGSYVHWLRVRRQYQYLETGESELSAILRRIASPCLDCGRAVNACDQ